MQVPGRHALCAQVSTPSCQSLTYPSCIALHFTGYEPDKFILFYFGSHVIFIAFCLTYVVNDEDDDEEINLLTLSAGWNNNFL